MSQPAALGLARSRVGVTKASGLAPSRGCAAPSAGGSIIARHAQTPPPAQRLVAETGDDLAEGHENGASLHQHPVLSIEREDGACVVRLAGELDLYNANDVRQALFDACADRPERLVVDLGEVDFVDSTALGVLIEARTKLTNKRAFI